MDTSRHLPVSDVKRERKININTEKPNSQKVERRGHLRQHTFVNSVSKKRTDSIICGLVVTNKSIKLILQTKYKFQ